MSKRKVTLALLLTIALWACGKSSDTTRVTINAGFGTKGPQNPGQNFFNLKSFTLGQDCAQTGIYLSVFDSNINKFIANKPIKLRSNMGLNYNGSDSIAQTDEAITYMQSPYSFVDEALSIDVPKGRTIDIAIIGSFLKAQDSNLDGICDLEKATPVPSPTPGAVDNFSMIGHTQINVSSPTTVQLNVKVLKSYDTNANAYNLNNTNGRDWLQLGTSFIFSSGSAAITAIHSHQDKNGSYLIHQLTSLNAAQNFYIPHLFPFQVDFVYTQSTNIGFYSATVYTPDYTGGSINASLTSAWQGSPPSSIQSAAAVNNEFKIISY